MCLYLSKLHTRYLELLSDYHIYTSFFFSFTRIQQIVMEYNSAGNAQLWLKHVMGSSVERE